MANATRINSTGASKIRASLYDRVSAGLWSLILVFGVLALIVVLMWLQVQRRKSALEQLIPVAQLAPGDIGEAKPLGVGDDAEDPGVEDFPEVEIPQLADAVEAVTDAPSRVRGLLANVDGNAAEMGTGRGLGSRNGGGGGSGGGKAERWSIEYEAENISKYLEQLATFGVEIGFINKVSDRVEIIFDLTSAPKIRQTSKGEERRVYFIHANSKLRRWDQRVAQTAGVKPAGKIMVQFYPEAIASLLGSLEAAEAAKRKLDLAQIQRTIFKVRPAGNGFEYYVADIVPK